MNDDIANLIASALAKLGIEVLNTLRTKKDVVSSKELRLALIKESYRTACLIAQNNFPNGITGDDLSYMAGVVHGTLSGFFEELTGITLFPTLDQLLKTHMTEKEFEDIVYLIIKEHSIDILEDKCD